MGVQCEECNELIDSDESYVNINDETLLHIQCFVDNNHKIQIAEDDITSLAVAGALINNN